MSDWKVNLEFVEGGSSKFWRARIDGSTLYVNYGRIGTGGQTQVKQLASAEACVKELEKLEREKRKKGYLDAGSAPPAEREEDGDEGDEGEDDGEEAEAKPAKAAPAPVIAAGPAAMNLGLDRPDRKVEVRLVQDGAGIKLVAVERYASPEDAKKALERLQAAFEAEGYKRGAAREI